MYDLTSGSDIAPCNKADKLLVVYIFINVMMSIRQDKIYFEFMRHINPLVEQKLVKID